MSELTAYIRSTRARAQDLLGSLQAIDVARPGVSLNDSIHRFAIVAAQADALIDEACVSSQWASARNQAANSIIHPLIAGYNPTDQARIKPIPENEQRQASALAAFNATESADLTATDLEARINEFNLQCQILKQSIDRAIAQAESQNVPVSTLDAKTLASRREAEDAELKRVMRVMCGGRGLRVD